MVYTSQARRRGDVRADPNQPQRLPYQGPWSNPSVPPPDPNAGRPGDIRPGSMMLPDMPRMDDQRPMPMPEMPMSISSTMPQLEPPMPPMLPPQLNNPAMQELPAPEALTGIPDQNYGAVPFVGNQALTGPEKQGLNIEPQMPGGPTKNMPGRPFTAPYKIGQNMQFGSGLRLPGMR